MWAARCVGVWKVSCGRCKSIASPPSPSRIRSFTTWIRRWQHGPLQAPAMWVIPSRPSAPRRHARVGTSRRPRRRQATTPFRRPAQRPAAASWIVHASVGRDRRLWAALKLRMARCRRPPLAIHRAAACRSRPMHATRLRCRLYRRSRRRLRRCSHPSLRRRTHMAPRPCTRRIHWPIATKAM